MCPLRSGGWSGCGCSSRWWVWLGGSGVGVVVGEGGGEEGPLFHGGVTAPAQGPSVSVEEGSGPVTFSSSVACVPSVLSYNVRSLSNCSEDTVKGKYRKERCHGAVVDLSKGADIVCLQETKLSTGEHFAFTSAFKDGHVDFNSFRKGVAGTLIIDTPRLCHFYTGSPVPLGPLAKGYVQLRRYAPKDPGRPPFQLFNFYLHSGREFGLNSAILESLLSVDASVPTFVCGDLNFIELSTDTTSAAFSPPPPGFC